MEPMTDFEIFKGKCISVLLFKKYLLNVVFCYWSIIALQWPLFLSLQAKIKKYYESFPGGSVVKNLPANSGDMGSVPGLGRSPGVGNGNLL